MTRLFNIILNILHLLKSQGRYTPDPINHQHDTGDFKAELQLIQAALKQIDAEAKADRALQNEKLRLERKRLRTEQVTLAIVIVGTLGAFANLWFLKASTNITEQQLLAMYSTVQIQQRAYVNVQNIELLSFKVGKRPEARILYKNSGLTPANHLTIAPDSFLFEFPTVGPFPAPPPIKETYLSCATEKGPGPILPPGVMRTVNTLRVIAPIMHGMHGGPLGPLTNKSLHDVRHMAAMWYVVVYIVYIDSFGDCHRSIEPFEFDPFTQTFNPSSINAIPDLTDNRHTKKQMEPYTATRLGGVK